MNNEGWWVSEPANFFKEIEGVSEAGWVGFVFLLVG